MKRPEWVEVGRISRAHGVQGELRVVPTSDNPDRFQPGSVLYGRPERVGLAGAHARERVRLTVRSIRGDEDFPIVAFAEIGHRDAAEALRGYLLEVQGVDLPDLDEDEYYPFDLIGLEVRDSEGARWGRVVDAVETPGHALLAVVADAGAADARSEGEPEAGAERRAQGEILVPFVSEAVPTVSLEGGYLTVTTRFLQES